MKKQPHQLIFGRRFTVTKTFLQAINEGLRQILETVPESYILGEDVGTYGGGFGATKGLVADFPDRVLDTPISEFKRIKFTFFQMVNNLCQWLSVLPVVQGQALVHNTLKVLRTGLPTYLA